MYPVVNVCAHVCCMRDVCMKIDPLEIMQKDLDI